MKSKTLFIMSLCHALVFQSLASTAHAAPTALADRPIGSSGAASVPANVLFTPSVEFPTAVSHAHIGNFDAGREYIGYFDPYKCYSYDATGGYFNPVGFTIGVTVSAGQPIKGGSRFCSGQWSGNFLNWATMQTIDTFRQTLTGGDRRVDTTSLTVVQKAWASGQGGTGNFPTKSISGSANVANVSPYTWGELHIRVQGLGRNFRAHWDRGTAENGSLDTNEVEMQGAVRVCRTDQVSGASLEEGNCFAYPGGTSKPVGLIQQSESRMRFGVIAYLNDSNALRDGGVLRARMKAVGPTEAVPGAPSQPNTKAEWDPSTGIFVVNPDSVDASASGVSNSGVINYLNKFGASGSYKTFDNVGEMYYAALRYLRNAGSVTEWHNNLNDTQKDGFPVITNWEDPIRYQCQKNFTIGIGDVNTHRDRNVPGGTNPFGGEPSMPAQVSADTGAVNAHNWTNDVGTYEGMGAIAGTNGGCCSASWYIAGLAHWAKTQDIRPDLPNRQTVDFYWVDVLEYSNYRHKNLYWMAAKYGGFTDINGDGKPDTTSEWRATNNRLTWGGTTYDLPDNYFVAGNPQGMVDGLKRAFASISSKISRNAGLAVDTADVTSAGSEGYLPSYNPSNWSGDLKAYSVSADAAGVVTSTYKWSAQEKLEAQAAGTGWNTARNIVTGNGNSTGFTAVPFRFASLTTAQRNALSADSSVATNLVNYIRGERTQEGLAFRVRDKLLGSIVNSEPAAVGAPNAMYSDGSNPGYSAFKLANQTRPPMVYASANDGMLHAFWGSLTDSNGGREAWAYVPSSLLNAGSVAEPNGLLNFANTPYDHRYLVDGPIRVQDVDFNNTGTGGSGSGDWRTLLIGGLGKGGRSYFAIDVTNPSSMTSETSVASKVLWEFTDADMGLSYGMASVFKTERYGWVVAFGSGYNTPTGRGFVYLLNAKTGELLQKIPVASGTTTDPAGLAHLSAYVPDLSDYTADTIYAGDLLGRVFRIDLKSSTTPYPVAQIASLIAANGQPQPITTFPEVQSMPGSQERFVFFGTGRYLDETDTTLNQTQSLYAIKDGTRYKAQLDAHAVLPAIATRGSMQAVTNLASGITLASDRSGWYYDLPNGSIGVNERSVVAPTAFGGQVVFATITPGADTCASGGTGRLYALGFMTARTQFPTNTITVPSNIVRTKIIGAGSRIKVLATIAGLEGDSAPPAGCTTDFCQVNLTNPTPNQTRRLNSREIRPQ